MRNIDDMLDEWRGIRADLQGRLKDLQSGYVQLRESKGGSDWQDITDREIWSLRTQINRYEEMIEAAERSRAKQDREANS